MSTQHLNLKRNVRRIKGDLDLAQAKAEEILKDEKLSADHGKASLLLKRIKDAILHLRTGLGE